MKITAITNPINNYRKINKNIHTNPDTPTTQNTEVCTNAYRPAFMSNSLMRNAGEYINGNIRFDKSSMQRFSEILKSRDFNPFADIAMGRKSFLSGVFNNISNPFAGMVILNYFQKIDDNFLKENLFQGGRINVGLAQLDYSEQETRAQLRNLYRYAANELNIRVPQTYPHIAILEGIRNNNAGYLRVLMDDRELAPVMPNGEISVPVILEGREHFNPEIRRFFDDQYLIQKALNRDSLDVMEQPKPVEIIHGKNFFTPKVLNDMYSSPLSIEEMANDRFTEPAPKKIKYTPFSVKQSGSAVINKTAAALEFSKQAEEMIARDEEEFGEVKFQTLYNIVADKNFPEIKDKKYDISGSTILHLVAQAYINPNNEAETSALGDLLYKLVICKYNFNALNDFGETAMKQAVDSENIALLQDLMLFQDNIIDKHACGPNAQSAAEAMTESENNEIFNLYNNPTSFS